MQDALGGMDSAGNLGRFGRRGIRRLKARDPTAVAGQREMQVRRPKERLATPLWGRCPWGRRGHAVGGNQQREVVG